MLRVKSSPRDWGIIFLKDAWPRSRTIVNFGISSTVLWPGWKFSSWVNPSLPFFVNVNVSREFLAWLKQPKLLRSPLPSTPFTVLFYHFYMTILSFKLNLCFIFMDGYQTSVVGFFPPGIAH